MWYYDCESYDSIVIMHNQEGAHEVRFFSGSNYLRYWLSNLGLHRTNRIFKEGMKVCQKTHFLIYRRKREIK